MNKSIKITIVACLTLISLNCLLPPRVSTETNTSVSRGFILSDVHEVSNSLPDLFRNTKYSYKANIDSSKLFFQNILLIALGAIALVLNTKTRES
jgi:hypothetical protein